MSEDATAQVRVELTLDVARQAATVRGGRSHLGEHVLRVLRDQLVQHGALGLTASVGGERLSGRAGRSFVDAVCEHVRAV
jgi:hypothetical protein